MSRPAVSVPARPSSATRRLTLAVAASALVFAVLQIALGASPLLVVALVGVIIVTLVPVRVYGLAHIVGLLFLAICFYFGYLALLAPTLILRRADAELFVPELSSMVVFAFAASAAAGALAARLIFPYLPLLVRPIEDPRTLRRLAVVALALGVVGMGLSRLQGWAVSLGAFLGSYLILAFAFELTATLKETGNRRSMSPLAIVLAAAIFVGTVTANSKSGLFIAIGAWATANIMCGRRLNWRLIVPGAMLGVLLTYFFLSVNMVRMYREEVSGLELMTMTAETAVGLATADADTLVQLERMKGDNVNTNPLFYSVTYFEGLPVLIERFIMLPYADAVLRSTDPAGPFAGNSFLTRQLWDMLPAFLNPDKDTSYSGNIIVVALGLGDPSFNGNPTIGLAAEFFYAGGYVTVIVGAALLFFLISVVLGTTVGSVAGNAFGVYVFVRYVHFLVVGAGAGVVFFMSRQLPFDLTFLLIMTGALAGKPPLRWRRASAVT